MLKIGMDLGNSTVKGAVLDENNRLLATIHTPSAVAVVEQEKYLTFQDEETQYIKIISSPLRHPDGWIAVGQHALQIPGYKEYDVLSSEYKTNHPLTTALFFGLLAQHIEEDTSIRTALSVPIIESKTLGLTDDYRQLLMGTHELIIQRKEQSINLTVTIESALVVNEGQAGFFGLLDTTDDIFQEAMSVVYASEGEDENPLSSLDDFLVCDIGEGTSDVSVFRLKKFNPDYSFSVTQGIGNMYERAMKQAQREQLTMESRQDLQRLFSRPSKRQAKRRERWETYVNPERDVLIEELVDTILKAYGNRDYFDAIIFCGGGFSALTGYRLDETGVTMRDHTLFEELTERLDSLNKSVDLMFGIPEPYSQTINQRGLIQLLTTM